MDPPWIFESDCPRRRKAEEYHGDMARFMLGMRGGIVLQRDEASYGLVILREAKDLCTPARKDLSQQQEVSQDHTRFFIREYR